MEYIKLAQDFVNKTKKLFDIDMNIINDKGIIISSSQIERIGDFHEMAYHMITHNIAYSDNEIITNSLKGVRTGVNLLLKKNNVPYGVIGITGVPKENEKLIYVLKYFFETLDDYARNSIFEYTPQIDELAFSLFFEKPANYSKILNLFDQKHRDPKTVRLPVLINLNTSKHTSKLFFQLKNHFSDATQSLMFIINSCEILLFFQTNYQEEPCSIIGELERELNREAAILTEESFEYRLFYTLPVEDITMYFLSYCQLIWLEELHVYNKEKIVNITDHMTLLIISSQNWHNYNNVLVYYEKKLKEAQSLEEFITIGGALITHNMNYQQAADALFVHKNTIVFRMNKIKNILQLDPYNNTSHMSLFHYLYYYIQLDNNMIPSFQKFYNKFNT